jgi:dTDP-4-amino-4,6-dideoxygalactose transaminase
LTRTLLANVDYAAVVQRRRQNFAAYRQSLHEFNQLTLDADPLDVPFCYPLLPRAGIDRRHLYESRIFVAQFWKEVATRPIAGFTWERSLTDRLLPLPVDHRLEPADVEYVIEAFDRLVAV